MQLATARQSVNSNKSTGGRGTRQSISDSVDQLSETSSPKLAPRSRTCSSSQTKTTSNENAGLVGLRNIGNTVIGLLIYHLFCSVFYYDDLITWLNCFFLFLWNSVSWIRCCSVWVTLVQYWNTSYRTTTPVTSTLPLRLWTELSSKVLVNQ